MNKLLMMFLFPLLGFMKFSAIELSDENVSGVADNPDMIPEIWSPIIYEELRERLAWLNIFSREYEGEITDRGDQVTVNQIVAPKAQRLTDDKTKFATSKLQTNSFKIVADKTAIASFEITNRKKLQSIDFQVQAIDALTFSIMEDLEDFILSLLRDNLDPQLDFTISNSGPTGEMIARDVTKLRAGLSKIGKVPFGDGQTFLGVDPDGYGDLMGQEKVSSADFSGGVNSLISGEVNRLAGFGAFEHNKQNSYETFGVHRSALQMVLQEAAQVKISDLHSNNKLGHLVSAHMHYGAELFDNKRYGRLSKNGQTDLGA